ncbi:MAG: GumC family protein [Pirellulales bacterium]
MQAHPRALPTLPDLVDILLRHKWKMLLFFAATLALVYIALRLWPRSYGSEAKLFVRLGRESVGLDPTATTGETIGVYDSREHEINSVVGVLQSRVLIEEVVDKLGAEAILSGGPTTATADDDGAGVGARLRELVAALGLTDPVLPRDRAIIELGRSISIDYGRKSSVVAVRVKADTPEFAQTIGKAFLEAFHEQHLNVNHTPGSYEFFDEQWKVVTADLDKALNELSEAKTRDGISSVESQREILQDEAKLIENGIITAQSDLAAAEARVVSLEGELAILPETMTTATTSGFPNDSLHLMRERLYELQIQEQEAAAKFTPDHPNRQALERQVSSAAPLVESEERHLTQITTAVNPIRQEVSSELELERSHIAALHAKVDSLMALRSHLRDQVYALNQHAVEIEVLESRVSLLKDKHLQYGEYREQARVDQELESNRISNVNIFQPPTLESKPTSPKPSIVLGLGLILATCGALGLALLCEHFDLSLKSAEEVEDVVGSPVLITIPRASRFRALVR